MGSARPTGMIFSPSDQERFREIAHGARAAALKQCLPLGLIVAIAVGLAAPVVVQAFASVRLAGFGVLDTLCVWLIFFISGLTLKTEDAKQALAAWRALLWSLFAILGATPLVAPLASRIPPPFPREFALGFAIFCAMPTTINTGVALTVQAKGSFALALVITVSTNLLAVFTVPFYLSAVLQLAAVAIDPVQLLAKLLMLILLPLLAGKGTRELSAAARRLAAARKQQLSLCSNAALVLVPWMKLTQSAGALRSASAPSLLLVLLLALAIHLLFLGFNLAGSRALKLPDEQLRAVVIMGSQKTLPMAMAILAALPPSVGSAGLVAIPPIVCHLTQIFVDAWLAARWALRDPLALPIAAPAEGPRRRPPKPGRRGEPAMYSASERGGRPPQLAIS